MRHPHSARTWRRGFDRAALRLRCPCNGSPNSLQETPRMQIVRTLTFLAIAASSTSQDIVGPEGVAAPGVLDGGTIAAAGHGRVKLAGIKAPRLGRGVSPD